MEKNNNTLIYGVHPIIEAMEAGQAVDKIFLRQGSTHGRLQELEQMARKTGVPVQVVPDAKIQRLAGDANHQGVVAILASIEYQELEAILLDLQERGEVPLLVMLDGVTDVRNFGAIARTAECMGAHAIIIPIQGSAGANADAIKVSAGALHHLPVCREKLLLDSLLMLQSYGVRTIGCTEKARETIYEQDLTEGICIIMGSEEKGLSTSILKRADVLAKIPLKGQVESLNVSVAAGMVLSEVARQRG